MPEAEKHVRLDVTLGGRDEGANAALQQAAEGLEKVESQAIKTQEEIRKLTPEAMSQEIAAMVEKFAPPEEAQKFLANMTGEAEKARMATAALAQAAEATAEPLAAAAQEGQVLAGVMDKTAQAVGSAADAQKVFTETALPATDAVSSQATALTEGDAAARLHENAVRMLSASIKENALDLDSARDLVQAFGREEGLTTTETEKLEVALELIAPAAEGPSSALTGLADGLRATTKESREFNLVANELESYVKGAGMQTGEATAFIRSFGEANALTSAETQQLGLALGILGEEAKKPGDSLAEVGVKAVGTVENMSLLGDEAGNLSTKLIHADRLLGRIHGGLGTEILGDVLGQVSGIAGILDVVGPVLPLVMNPAVIGAAGAAAAFWLIYENTVVSAMQELEKTKGRERAGVWAEAERGGTFWLGGERLDPLAAKGYKPSELALEVEKFIEGRGVWPEGTFERRIYTPGAEEEAERIGRERGAAAEAAYREEQADLALRRGAIEVLREKEGEQAAQWAAMVMPEAVRGSTSQDVRVLAEDMANRRQEEERRRAQQRVAEELSWQMPGQGSYYGGRTPEAAERGTQLRAYQLGSEMGVQMPYYSEEETKRFQREQERATQQATREAEQKASDEAEQKASDEARAQEEIDKTYRQEEELRRKYGQRQLMEGATEEEKPFVREWQAGQDFNRELDDILQRREELMQSGMTEGSVTAAANLNTGMTEASVAGATNLNAGIADGSRVGAQMFGEAIRAALQGPVIESPDVAGAGGTVADDRQSVGYTPFDRYAERGRHPELFPNDPEALRALTEVQVRERRRILDREAQNAPEVRQEVFPERKPDYGRVEREMADVNYDTEQQQWRTWDRAKRGLRDVTERSNDIPPGMYADYWEGQRESEVQNLLQQERRMGIPVSGGAKARQLEDLGRYLERTQPGIFDAGRRTQISGTLKIEGIDRGQVDLDQAPRY